jgi:hypothetical protein
MSQHPAFPLRDGRYSVSDAMFHGAKVANNSVPLVFLISQKLHPMATPSHSEQFF